MTTLDSLPPLAREIVALVGLEAAMALINAYPGVAIEVPRGHRASPMQAGLRRIMGREAADTLIQHYGGTVLRVPMCKRAMQDARDAEIIAKVDGGSPVWQVAIEHGLHERTVWRILKRSPGAVVPGLGERHEVVDDQMPLF